MTPPGDLAKVHGVSANAKRVVATVECLVAACSYDASGSVSVPNKAIAAKRFKLRTAKKAATQGQRVKLTLKLKKKARRAAKKALKQKKFKKKVRAKVAINVTDGAGNKQTLRPKRARLKAR